MRNTDGWFLSFAWIAAAAATLGVAGVVYSRRVLSDVERMAASDSYLSRVVRLSSSEPNEQGTQGTFGSGSQPIITAARLHELRRVATGNALAGALLAGAGVVAAVSALLRSRGSERKLASGVNRTAAADGSRSSRRPAGRRVSGRGDSAEATDQQQPCDEPSTQDRLRRRIRQLNCFYGLSKFGQQPDITLEQIFQESTELIRKAYQDPQQTCVRITFDGIQYKTDNFDKSEYSQCAPIEVRREKAGSIEVYYLGAKQPERPCFLDEEREMLGALAEHLGRVAEAKQSDERLRLFRSLIDRSNDCIYIIDCKWGRLLDANQKACEMLGYSRQELLEMTIKDIDELVDSDQAWQKQVQQLQERTDIIVQGTHRRKDGGRFDAETSLKFVSHRRENYIIAVTRDITERKKSEEEQRRLIESLKRVNEKVKSINQELKDFAYVVSHDLKAPLRGIRTLADWIATDYADKLDEKGKEQLELLVTRVKRMHNLIEGVLQYSRVGRMKEKKVKVDLNQLIPEIIDMVAPPENIKVTVETTLPVVECERTPVVSVFENLLSNAVKYMDKPEGDIRIGCTEEDGYWKFSVSDNGPGIDSRYFDKIFRIFQTLSTRDDFESTGIGLTVVKKAVELNGGKVWVESEVGKGSTFYFTLPKAQSEVQDAELEAHIAC